MKPIQFELHTPDDLPAVYDLLSRYHDESQILAGGQSLIPLLNFRLATPSHVIALSHVKGIHDLDCEESIVGIGAGVTQREVERDEVLNNRAPIIKTVLKHASWPVIRNRGTWCGSLAYADPTGHVPALARALGGTVQLESSRGSRKVEIEDLILGPFFAGIESDEMLTAYQCSLDSDDWFWGYSQVAWSHRVLAGAITRITRKGDELASVRIVGFGAYRGLWSRDIKGDDMDAQGVRLEDVYLRPGWIDEVISEVSGPKATNSVLDLGLSVDYGFEMLRTTVRRSLVDAMNRALTS